MQRPFLTSYWLEYDRILCGDHPFAVPGLEGPEALSALVEAGIRVFVDLTSEGEKPPYSELALRTAIRLRIDPAELSFHRLPILRGASPHNANHLRALLRTIRLARVRGKKVYLHCANGHGRTGTIAGCLYREIFNFAPNAAIGQLATSLRDYGNPDGREFGSDLRFGETPETQGQGDFIRHWHPHRSINHSEVLGGILGAAAAETSAVTSPIAPRTAAFHESMILAMIDGLYRPGSYEHSWTEEPLDPSPFEHARERRRNNPEGSLSTEQDGNVCNLPSLLPFALSRHNCADLIDRVTTAISSARALDLSDDRSRFCAVFYCLVVSDLIHGSSIATASQFAWDAMAGSLASCMAGPSVTERLDPHGLFERSKSEMASPGDVDEILAAALWSVHHADNYRVAVLLSAGLGGDSGTVASISGGLAGIVHGEASIPDDWHPGIHSPSFLRRRTEAFRSFIGQEGCLRIAGLPE
jgi:hypothetical protein